MAATLPLLLLFFTASGLAQEELRSVDELLEEVAEEHAERPAVMELQRAAVQGMLQWLETQDGSEHLRVLTRAEHERFQAYAQGERFGVGIGVLLVPGYGIRILEVFPGTPAEQAGLVPGEVVLAVGGVPVEQRSAVEVAAMLTARDREQLTLDLLDGQGVPRRVSLEPQRYRAPVLSTTEGEGYLLVRLHHFGAGAAEALAGVLERVGPRELVIDLRDARDGLLPEAVATAALFLGSEELAGYRLLGESEGQPLLLPEGPRWDQPLAVLVNGGTAGVAELFVASIQRVNPRMGLVGTPTAGVATLPAWVPLGAEHLLQLAGERLVLADGTTWSRVGVIPDVVVQPLDGWQLMPPPAVPPDLQIDAALRLVRSPSSDR